MIVTSGEKEKLSKCGIAKRFVKCQSKMTKILYFLFLCLRYRLLLELSCSIGLASEAEIGSLNSRLTEKIQ